MGGITKGQKRRGTETLRKVPYLRVANVQRGFLDLSEIKEIEATEVEINELRLVPGDVLLIEGGNREHLGRGWIWTGETAECIHQNHVFRARLRSSELQPKFFSWYANEVGQKYFNAEASQTVNLASINLSKLKKLSVAVPPPAEQLRIVAKVETLLARVNSARQQLAKLPAVLKRFRQSVLAAACSGRLTADWRGASTDDGLPGDWEVRRLDSLFEVRTGGTPSRRNPAYFTNWTIPWVKTSEVQNCDIFDTEEKITQAALENSSAKVFPPSTILVALYGEGRTRGQIARLRILAATNQACAALINPTMLEVTNRYVFITLLGAYDQLRGQSAGGNQPNLSNGLIRKWEIPFPPLAEQHEIVRRVDALFRLADAVEKRVAAATARAEKLTQAILAKAFRGELVPTEAELARREGRSYEPAAVLLERIRAERASSYNGARKAPTRRKAGQKRLVE